MAVSDLLERIRAQKRQATTPRIMGAKATGGFVIPTSPVAAPQGATLLDSLANRRSQGSAFLQNYKNQEVTKLATDVVDKSAGRVQTNEFGIPVRQKKNLTDTFSRHSETINQQGKLALQAEESRGAWREANRMQGLGAFGMVPGGMTTYDPKDLPPGVSKDNIGGRAVAIAMTAYKNGTPYVWGGNSLTGGVDCSGLVQQVYKRLGINLPRTSYEQARSGKVVSMNSLQPGDLIFYNTGGRDPNGIGSLSHVAIYIGNGMVLEAPGRGKKVQRNRIGATGTPAKAVRPW